MSISFQNKLLAIVRIRISELESHLLKELRPEIRKVTYTTLDLNRQILRILGAN